MPDLWWDTDYRLKGDVRVGGCDLVVIAARDVAHHPVVLTAVDWEHVRQARAEDRSRLLGRYAIVSRRRLGALLARAGEWSADELHADA